MSALPKDFFNVSRGRGGGMSYAQLPLPSDSHTIGIGTANCITCVGVYIPLDDSTCFIAHIYATTKPPDSDMDDDWWTPTPEQGEGLTQFIKKKLATDLQQWRPTELARKGTKIVCARSERDIGSERVSMTGYYIAQAVLDYMDASAEHRERMLSTNAHGIVVDCGTKECTVLRSSEEGNKIDDVLDLGWTKSQFADSLENWKIELVDGEWQVV